MSQKFVLIHFESPKEDNLSTRTQQLNVYCPQRVLYSEVSLYVLQLIEKADLLFKVSSLLLIDQDQIEVVPHTELLVDVSHGGC